MSEIISAREKLLRAALRLLAAERAEPHASFDAELEYAQDMVADAACDLVEAAASAHTLQQWRSLTRDARP